MTTTREQRAIHPTVEVRRRDERFHTRIDWLDSRHSFSFSHHYDPANTHHGLLLVSNDDVVKPNTGFRTHPHRDMEILTYIAERDGVRAAEVATYFEKRDGIRRTTVLKAIDRLMAKEFLEREGQWGEFTYRSRVAPADVQNVLTRQFVHETLGGSITPFVAYLNGGAKLSQDDIAELRAVLDKLEGEKK